MTVCDGPLAVDGHDLGADLVVGRVEADGEFGAQVRRLLGESLDAGNDAGGRDGHALRAQANFAHQQADRGHEVVVVEKRLAHAHEDQVHAVAADADGVAIENRDDLAGDFARREIALQAELGGEAELAVDGAADLRGDADGGAGPVFRSFSHPSCALRRKGWGNRSRSRNRNRGLFVSTVAGFAAVAFGHPDGFHGCGVAGAALDQIALRSIGGLKGLAI